MATNEDWLREMCYHLEEALERNDYIRDELKMDKLPLEYCIVPTYAIDDAIERLRRYDTITMNLLKTAFHLWCELEGETTRSARKIKDSPYTASDTDVVKNQAVFVKEIDGEGMDKDISFIQIALQFARMRTGDPTGLNQYLNKEDDIFDYLWNEIGDVNG